MNDEDKKAKLHFSYAKLSRLGKTALSLLDRDVAQLASYGVDAAYKATLKASLKQFNDTPTDEELKGRMISLTEDRNRLADELRVQIRTVMVRVEKVFPKGSSKYVMFGVEGLSRLDDMDLRRCGHRVAKQATKWQAELAPKGVDAAMIAKTETLADDFLEAILDQDDAPRYRASVAEDRLKLAHKLYDNIIELFDFGKDYWYTRNNAKYRNYLIYDSEKNRESVGKLKERSNS